MKRVLQERGLWEESLRGNAVEQKRKQETEEHYRARLEINRCEKGKGCCALRLLENEPEFLNEKPLEVEITRYVGWSIDGS